MTETEKRRVAELRAAGHGYKSISYKLGISVNTISSFCRRNTLETLPEKKCENCGKPITENKKHKPRRFCSDLCRIKWWNSHLDQVEHKAVYRYTCPTCGEEFQVYGNSKRKYCSHECYIKKRFGK